MGLARSDFLADRVIYGQRRRDYHAYVRNTNAVIATLRLTLAEEFMVVLTFSCDRYLGNQLTNSVGE